ncbi:MAG: peptidoglycan bridge formation glycyltransferase FemA/FemB family protein [Chloroflexota bacterium]
MTYEVREVREKDLWEEFSLGTHPNTLLQSWSWGEFNESLGRTVWRFGVFKENNLVAISLLIRNHTRLGDYLYCPHGPVFDWSDERVLDSLLAELADVAKDRGCIFMRFEPLLPENVESERVFQQRGFTRAPRYIQAQNVWLLPLDRSEDEILAKMRKTTRYSIRHEGKQGINVTVSTAVEDAETFIGMLCSTASRKNFAGTIHDREYYLKQFQVLAKAEQEKIFIAREGDDILSMAVVAYYGDSAYYLHGASHPNRKPSVGYSLQWEAIKEAKKMGCRHYNFWGVLREKDFQPKHPWYGFSLFKRGFGGLEYAYLSGQDYPLGSKYHLYRWMEQARRLAGRLKTGYWLD